MAISDRMWERTALVTRFDRTSTAELMHTLAAAHYGRERLTRIPSNVPDTTPQAITTHFLSTGLGAVVRAEA